MNRLERLFANKPEGNILSIYFTAGFPHKESTGTIIRELAAHGIDMIEVGVPFSDPMADGPVIQGSSTTALREGMTLDLLLNQVKEARTDAGDIPLVLMGYLNPMLQFGFERLLRRCLESGIDALIIPDLPFAEYMEEFKPLCDTYGIPVIMLITPETSEERIHLIDDHCSGFIYMVSSASTTGTRDKFSDEQTGYFRRIAGMKLKHPRLIGFGISNPATLSEAQGHAAGAIVGSLFIKCLDSHPDNIGAAVGQLLKTLGRTTAQERG